MEKEKKENQFRPLEPDWVKYNHLMRKDPDKRTSDERRFCIDMYHLEEFQAGML